MAHDSTFSCPACGAEFQTREQLERHDERDHGRHARTGGDASSSTGGAGAPSGERPRDNRTGGTREEGERG